MAGINSSQRLEDLGVFAKQRPQTEEATWRLLGALSFLSPVHEIPVSVFQPYSFSSTSETATTNIPRSGTATTSAAAAAASASNANTKKDASGVKARARRELNYRKMLQDPLPWVVITTTTASADDDDEMDLDADDDTIIGNNSRARSGSVAIQNLFEEALQPLLETGIVRRAHVRGPIVHIDPDTQALSRSRTIKKHGQRDFDLAVRIMLRAMPASSSIITSPSTSSPTSPIYPSASSSRMSTAQSNLLHHVLTLASHYEHHAG